MFRTLDIDPNVEQSMANMSELEGRIVHARRAGCLIEVVSLRLQYLDGYLRKYFNNTPNGGRREREFGKLLKQCVQLGLEKSIYDRIVSFNKARVNAIHGYLTGAMVYTDLSVVLEASDGISEVLAEFVLLNCGEVVTPEFEKKHSNRGGSNRAHAYQSSSFTYTNASLACSTSKLFCDLRCRLVVIHLQLANVLMPYHPGQFENA